MSKGKVFLLIGVIVIAFAGAGVYLGTKNKDVVGTVGLIKVSPAEKAKIEEAAVYGVPTNAPAGTNATSTVKQFTGSKAFGTITYVKGYPSANFIAEKDSQGNWKITKTDVKYGDNNKVVKTGTITSL